MQYENATEADLCRQAIMVQDACNLSGVLHSFHALTVRLRELNHDPKDHPSAVLFLDKVMDLMNCRITHDRTETFGPALDECRRLGGDDGWR